MRLFFADALVTRLGTIAQVVAPRAVRRRQTGNGFLQGQQGGGGAERGGLSRPTVRQPQGRRLRRGRRLQEEEARLQTQVGLPCYCGKVGTVQWEVDVFLGAGRGGGLFVFCRLADGNEFLFQAKDEVSRLSR